MFGEKNNLLLYQHLKSFSQYCSASYLGLFIQQLSKSFSLTIFFCQLSRMAKCPSPTSPTSCSGEIWTGFSSTKAHTRNNCFEEIFLTTCWSIFYIKLFLMMHLCIYLQAGSNENSKIFNCQARLYTAAEKVKTVQRTELLSGTLAAFSLLMEARR